MKILAAIVAVMCVVGLAHSADVDVDPGVALRSSTAMFYNRSDALGLDDGWFGVADLRARPTLLIRGAFASFGLELETRSAASSEAALAGQGASILGSAQPLRLHPLRYTPVDEGDVTISGWIDRADLSFAIGPVDVQIGRQPFSLGTAHFVGVLDIVAPFAPGDLDATYKPGVDAARVRTVLDGTVELELAGIFAEPSDWSGALARSRFQILSFDIEAVVARLRERVFGGLGWQGELGDVEFWGEGAVFERKSEQVFGGSDAVAFSAVSGLVYKFPGNVYGGLAGLYQDFGVRDAADLVAFYFSEPAVQGWLHLGSAGYAIVTLSRKLSPLLNLSGAGIVNAVDGSTLWQPALAYSVGDNADLTLFAWAASGRTPRAGTAALPEIRSEFGAAPSGFGLYGRWFF